jgi:hypothetical protein
MSCPACLFFRSCFLGSVEGPFSCPGLILSRQRAQPRSGMAAGHRRSRRAASLTSASTMPASVLPGPHAGSDTAGSIIAPVAL